MAQLELRGVSRAFGGLQAVCDVDLVAPAGQITGLIGPNGAGKTTVVNLVTGLLRLSSGRVMLDDRDLSRLEPHEVAVSGVARTFQNIRLLAEETVLTNVLAGFYMRDRVALWRKALGLPLVWRQEAAFRERALGLLAQSGMAGQADQLAGELSYGHQRRVEIMRAMATEPKVLLLDEPVAGMNDQEAETLGASFRRLADGGIAILLIEHNMRLMMSLCDRLYVLATGKIIARGPPGQVREDKAVIEAYLGG